MDLGAFSVSLAVKDLEISRAFYAELGFETFAGTAEHGYLILKNGEHLIGLFQGMFESNILTFNPGWSTGETNPTEFTDVRQLASKLHEAGIKTQGNLEESPKGPGHFTITDPDGNTILIDQHV